MLHNMSISKLKDTCVLRGPHLSKCIWIVWDSPAEKDVSKVLFWVALVFPACWAAASSCNPESALCSDALNGVDRNQSSFSEGVTGACTQEEGAAPSFPNPPPLHLWRSPPAYLSLGSPQEKMRNKFLRVDGNEAVTSACHHGNGSLEFNARDDSFFGPAYFIYLIF